MLSPNQTKYTLTRTDPISRYRITLSARTQVGAGEVVTVDTPLKPDEGKSLLDVPTIFNVEYHGFAKVLPYIASRYRWIFYILPFVIVTGVIWKCLLLYNFIS